MKLQAVTRQLEPRTPFRISRGEKKQVENVYISLEQDGVVGYGEASPNRFYGETAKAVMAKLMGLQSFLQQRSISCVQDIAALWRESRPLLQPSRAPQCALDVALWDL